MREAMLAAVPSLRAFAISLCGKADGADDLVQETLLRAIGNINSFQPGTNMCAWLFTILRNLFRSEYRKQRREVQDTDGSYLDSLKTPPEEDSRVVLCRRKESSVSLELVSMRLTQPLFTSPRTINEVAHSDTRSLQI
jgi:RNA polymerase sigma-70 factor (ECF subfamily)